MPFPLEGVDYMNTQPSSVEVCLAGTKQFACRYYDASGGTSAKCLDLTEANSLHASGLSIATVYETLPTSYGYFSYAQGQYDGGQAKARAQAAGQSTIAPIFFAVDYDATDAQLAAQITEYFNGVYAAMNGLYALGVYGSYRVVEYAYAHWPGVPGKWQTYAWSGGQVSTHNHLYQYLNGQSLCEITVDLDQCFNTGVLW